MGCQWLTKVRRAVIPERIQVGVTAYQSFTFTNAAASPCLSLNTEILPHCRPNFRLLKLHDIRPR